MGMAIYRPMYNLTIARGSVLGAGVLLCYSTALLPVAGAVFIGAELMLLTVVNWRSVRTSTVARARQPV